MKKLLLPVVGMVMAATAIAAPTAEVPVSDLLGLRSGFGSGGNVFASYGQAASGNQAAGVAKMLNPNYQSTAAASDQAPVTIVGCVVSPDHITGMWSYTTEAWSPSRISANANSVFASGGGFAAKDMYYVTQYREAMGFEEIKTLNYEINNDWAKYDEYTGDITRVATTMAYSENRDQAFGCFINSARDGYVFCEYNYSYFSIRRTICPIDKSKVWAGCAFSSDNTLYAITRAGELYTVDLATGKMTLVGNTGIEAVYMADATIDTKTDIMYWCVNSDTQNALYTVDLKTATPTKLYDLVNQEQICGMYIPHAVTTLADAPAALSSTPSASFSGASLSGKVSFSLPRYTFGQSLLDTSTELTWVLKANGKEVARGTGLPNARINADVTVDKPDSYNFAVVVSNAAGESPAKSTKKYVGPDTPVASSSFRLSSAGNTITLTWGAPGSSGVSGGYVQSSAATYTVVRYPDMKIVAQDVAVRSITDEIPETDEQVEYSYGLTVTVNGLTSAEKKSESFKGGAIVPPVDIKFDSALSLFGWTMAEGALTDTNKWQYYSSSNSIRLYSTTSTGQDDYAISPAVIVKAGASYPFSIDFRTSSYYEETFEVLWGTSPTVEAMTNVIVPETKLKSTSWSTSLGQINATADGKIYFAVHCKTPTASQLYAANIVIGEGIINLAPAATEFKVTPATDGTAKAVVTYTLPSTTVDGSALTEATALTKVEILRDGVAISSITENLPTAETAFTDDKDLTLGKHTYDVIAYNAYGAGKKNPIEVTVGPDVPAAPFNAKMIEQGNTGKVTISWDPVTTDVNGNPIMASAVTYKVVDRTYNVIVDNYKETSVEVQSVEPGQQEFRQYGVYAVTVSGESKLSGTAYKPVGTPYPTPWTESFANGTVSSIFGYNYIKDQEPWQFGYESEWSATPQDGDGGLAYFESYGLVQTALVTGKFDLTDVANPALTYYTFRYSDATYTNEFTIEADCGDGNGFVTVQSDPIFVGENGKWHKVVVDLSDYEGKCVVLRINPTCTDPKNKGAFYFLDNMRVSSHAEYNLTATRLEAPAAVMAGEEFEVNVVVTNTGDNEARGYEVELFSGETFIDAKAGPAVAPETSATLTFVTSNTVLDGETRDYHAVIVFSADEMEADNTTEPVTVGIVAPAVPVPSALTAQASGDAISLSWTAPDLASGAPAAYTETFESAATWAQAVEGWKIIDGDEAPLVSIRNPNFPYNAGKLAAWWVNDQNWSENSIELWSSHSGNKYLASGSVQRGNTPIQCDDWAISPRLYGGEQIVTLYARSFYGEGNYAGAYQEDFEVLYSTSTTNISDFVPAGYVKKAPFAWTKYSFRLPTGALYFAIRSRSTDQFFLFIDDVTYIPAQGEAAMRTLKGYNVYRNGVKVNSSLVTGTTYTDDKARADVDHTYVVTALYGEGESRPSNKATINLSGISDIETSGISVSGGEGVVIVSGAEGLKVEVYNAQGMAMASIAEAPAEARIAIGAGVYIVRVANAAVKVIVK